MNTEREMKGGRECAYRGSPVGETLPIISFVSAPLTGCCMTERRSSNSHYHRRSAKQSYTSTPSVVAAHTASVTKTAYSVTPGTTHTMPLANSQPRRLRTHLLVVSVSERNQQSFALN